jgi:hypothetical protein
MLDRDGAGKGGARLEAGNCCRPAGEHEAGSTRKKNASWHFSSVTSADAAVMFNISARRIARAREVLDKADPALVKAVEQGRVTVPAPVRFLSSISTAKTRMN